MKLLYTLTFLVILACGILAFDQETYQPLSETAVRDHFLDFTRKFQRFYKGPEEYEYRLKVFRENIETSRRMNIREGNNNYGITKFSDLTSDEFRKFYLMEKKTPKEIQKMMRMDSNKMVSNSYAKPAPDHYDWRNHGAITGVKDQGQCGSCWAFSAIGSIEGSYAIKHKQLVSFSEQQLVDCDNNCVTFENQQSCDDGCNGGLQWSAYQYLMKAGGVVTEKDYPYYAERYKCEVKPANFVAKLSNWTMLSTNETEMANWLAENGPIAVALNADFLQNYNNGIADPAWCDPTQLDHGVLIVGYGLETFWFGKPQPYWIVKNSWGYDFGEDGYFRIVKGVGRCGINTVPSAAFVY
ncbi:predicted protein [Naegleria gruberi]|uniref:Predicted protein n=1 Tax=Naegleria gruberi TaxID=5762 RepID=D2VLP8_NAEGR|nr:uncharacterized protein NAEGRDRAFT_69856 [Naegleria gruberi]EFC42175.1 predicted protein [Naegleria gruberi]|eukprot:XP_002674919.1 predicted protein [Naegleria gruberi strain NEG-M]